uniref:Protein kinase domain-containing protein n=1 Tax=viral metagenome TaxID=1070528 RepID=A0A6C0D8Z5_9ZZZZ
MENVFNINYEKRKNSELFSLFEKEDLTNLAKLQNYIPIYNKFFLLNETNYNSVNLNNLWHLKKIQNGVDTNNTFLGSIQNIKTNKIKKQKTFLKLAPLLDPFKYLIGKYNLNDTNLFELPKINSDIGSVHPKLMDYNNSAYVDGIFTFLSSTLIHTHNFVNGVDYYGSFLGIKRDFKINIAEDLDYLCKSDFFNKNKNIKFQVEDYSSFYKEDENNEPAKPSLKIQHNISIKSELSAKSIDNNIFEDIFSENSTINQSNHITLNDLKDNDIELVDVTNLNSMQLTDLKTTTIKSSSSCSSRTSYTSNNDDTNNDNNNGTKNDNNKNENENGNLNDDNKDFEDCDDCHDLENNKKTDEHTSTCSDKSDDWTDDNSSEFEEQQIFATIPEFPVQIICMENCDNTFDDLILKNDLSQEEWFSALFQVIMILITYQKTFSFTHNDLHTNNVMYNKTELKYIYYCYKKTYYKVPTYGRIFKIIDFGRAIYKFDGKLFCSDSFQPGADASTQYNTEPYFNEMKPRLEPNYSFDLCRLACSIFDYVIDDLDEIINLDDCEPIVKLIYEWCLDDNGINILYKNNGVERYPDFKLYKMIARCVHNHTPQAQLERKEFKCYSIQSKSLPMNEPIINIDSMPCFS